MGGEIRHRLGQCGGERGNTTKIICGDDGSICHVKYVHMFHTMLPLAEVLLLLVVLVMYLEVAPLDIPKVCSITIQQECLNQFVQTSGDFELAFAEMPCGSLRVMCWRSAYQQIHYSYALPPAAQAQYNASLEFCECMLTSGRGVAGLVGNEFPSKDAWRTADDNPYFCDDLKWVNLMAVGGLFIGICVVLVRAFVDNEEDLIPWNNNGEQSFTEFQDVTEQSKATERDSRIKRASSIVLVLDVLWISWSLGITLILRGHFVHGGTDCQFPEATLLTYVAVIAGVSFLCGVYALCTLLAVVCNEQARRTHRNRIAPGS
eukprot:m.66473 g.66473  ORF g.66473 m.66473 type:complete len:318 (-) comp15947_c0_seq2:284-1237(-)